MSKTFDITYEIVTPESAEYGDAEERGFIDRGLSLRDAVGELFRTRTNRVDGVSAIEANDSQPDFARWVTVSNGMEFETGAHESRSLHFPDSLTPSTRKRICKLICA